MSKQPTGFYFAIKASAGSRSIAYSKRQMEQELVKLLGQIPESIRPKLRYHQMLNFFFIYHNHSNRNDLIAIRKIIEEGVVSFRSRVSKVQSSDYHRAGYMLAFYDDSDVAKIIKDWILLDRVV